MISNLTSDAERNRIVTLRRSVNEPVWRSNTATATVTPGGVTGADGLGVAAADDGTGSDGTATAAAGESGVDGLHLAVTDSRAAGPQPVSAASVANTATA